MRQVRSKHTDWQSKKYVNGAEHTQSQDALMCMGTTTSKWHFYYTPCLERLPLHRLQTVWQQVDYQISPNLCHLFAGNSAIAVVWKQRLCGKQVRRRPIRTQPLNKQHRSSVIHINCRHLIGPAVRADFRRLYLANAKTPTCCPSDDNRTKVTNSVTSARSLWWHVALSSGSR